MKNNSIVKEQRQDDEMIIGILIATLIGYGIFFYFLFTEPMFLYIILGIIGGAVILSFLAVSNFLTK